MEEAFRKRLLQTLKQMEQISQKLNPLKSQREKETPSKRPGFDLKPKQLSVKDIDSIT
jgi:hypothetical protein